MNTLYGALYAVGQDHGEVMRFKFWAIAHKFERVNGYRAIPLLSKDREARLEELRNRAEIRRAIQRNADDGLLYMILWQRDCDMAEWEQRGVCADNVDAYLHFEAETYNNAEGPVNIRIVSKSEYDNFKPWSRDRALEAFEDGHPHVVYT